ncbi:20129_t:CDS:1, partial [Gigaspora rosea]
FCERKKTLNCVNIGCLEYSRSGTSKERFSRYSALNDNYWEEIQSDLEGHVELVEYESILVNLLE